MAHGRLILDQHLRLIAPHLVNADPWLLEGRAGSSRDPTAGGGASSSDADGSWPSDAGWSDAASFLRGLSPSALAECERCGLHNCPQHWAGMPPRLLEVCCAVRRVAAALGQHTADVLGSLGLSAETIKSLYSDGIVY